jgi:MoaA/NifB/PqqE/SkfB family radical SAM enzyme
MSRHQVLPSSDLPLDFLWLEVTNVCNLSCVHCYAESGPERSSTQSLSIDDYNRLLQDAYLVGCRKVQFIGGEPTAYPHLSTLLQSARRLGYNYIEVYTNLVRLHQALIASLVANEAAVATSIYSHDPDVHDSITQQRGSHAKTLENLKALLDTQVPVRVSIIEMDQNAGSTEETTRFLKDLGVRDVACDRLRHFGRAREVGASDNIAELCGTCAGGTLSISAEGKVSPCIMSRSWSVGSVKESSLASILESNALRSIRTRIQQEVVEPRELQALCNPQMKYPNPCTPRTSCSPCGPNSCSPCRPSGISRDVEKRAEQPQGVSSVD